MLKPKTKSIHLELRFHRDKVRMLDDLAERLNMRRSEVLMALVEQEWTAQHRLHPLKTKTA